MARSTSPTRTTIAFASFSLSALFAFGCGEEPAFPAEYRSAYVQILGCEASADHDLMQVSIWASPEAAPSYSNRVFPVPKGAVIVKEQYFDPQCGGAIDSFTTMRKDDSWIFQRVDGKRNVLEHGKLKACATCHDNCGANTDGLCAF